MENAGRSAETRCASTSTRRGSRPTTAEVRARASTPSTVRANRATLRAESGSKVCRYRGARLGRGDDENRLEVLAGPSARAAVDVPLVPVDETEVGSAQDLGIEIAAIVDDDAHPAAERG